VGTERTDEQPPIWVESTEETEEEMQAKMRAFIMKKEQRAKELIGQDLNVRKSERLRLRYTRPLEARQVERAKDITRAAGDSDIAEED
jgi:hypothetical protein